MDSNKKDSTEPEGELIINHSASEQSATPNLAGQDEPNAPTEEALNQSSNTAEEDAQDSQSLVPDDTQEVITEAQVGDSASTATILPLIGSIAVSETPKTPKTQKNSQLVRHFKR